MKFRKNSIILLGLIFGITVLGCAKSTNSTNKTESPKTIVDLNGQLQVNGSKIVNKTDEIVFFDRAMPDSITYYRVGGLDPKNVLPHCFKYKYNAIGYFHVA